MGRLILLAVFLWAGAVLWADESSKTAAAAAPKTEAVSPPAKEAVAPLETAVAPAPAVPAAGKRSVSKAHWLFIQSAAADPNDDMREAALDDLEVFIADYEGDPVSGEALVLLAEVLYKKGDHEEAAIAYLRALHEFPDAPSVFAVKKSYLELVDKKIGKKLKPAMTEAAKVADSKAASERLGELWHRLTAQAAEPLEKPLAKELLRLQARFPDNPQGDRVVNDLALLRSANSQHSSALLAHKKLLALYSESALRPASQWALGEGFERIKEYDRAIDSYQSLISQYPQTPQVLPAMEATARLLEDKKRSYDLALEVHEKIISSFPKNQGALKSFRAKARLEREKLKKPAEAVKTLQALTQQFGAQDGFDALRDAAAIARKDLKDYQLEADLRSRAAKDYQDLKDAADELYAAAEIYADDLEDPAKAAATYREVASKFPTHKLAKKAEARLAKMAKP